MATNHKAGLTPPSRLAAIDTLTPDELAELRDANDAKIAAQLHFDEVLARVRRKHKLYDAGDSINLKTGALTRA